MRFLIIILTIVLFTSCGKKMLPHETIKEAETVSTRTENKYHDTAIVLPGKLIVIKDKLQGCAELNYTKSESKDGLAATVTIKGSNIEVRCEADSLKHVIRFLQQQLTFTERIKQKEITKYVPVPGPVKYRIPGWCWIMLSAVLSYLAFKSRKTLSIGLGWLLDKVVK